METTLACPTCHVGVHPTDYFCSNCGKNLKPNPPSLSLTSQLSLYAKSLLLPPLGLLWAYPYLRQPDSRAKLVGAIAIFLTLAASILVAYKTKVFVDDLNRQVNQQMQLLY